LTSHRIEVLADLPISFRVAQPAHQMQRSAGSAFESTAVVLPGHWSDGMWSITDGYGRAMGREINLYVLGCFDTLGNSKHTRRIVNNNNNNNNCCWESWCLQPVNFGVHVWSRSQAIKQFIWRWAFIIFISTSFGVVAATF